MKRTEMYRRALLQVGLLFVLASLLMVPSIAFFPASVYADPILFENYDAGGGTGTVIYGDRWVAQTFKAQSAHSITSVTIKIGSRTGSPGTVTVSIRDGSPLGAELGTGTIDGNSLDFFSMQWIEITMASPFMVTSGNTYAIVVRATSGNETNNIKWQYAFPGTYVDGGQYYSSNGGSSFSGPSGDNSFQIYGLTPPRDTVYVNGTTGNDTYDGSSPTIGSGNIGPKATVGGAKDIVNPGGTIYVASGTYNDDIYIQSNLTLIGAGAQTTSISHYPVGCNESVIGVWTGGQPIHPTVTISGFTIQNGYYHGLDYGNGAGISVSDNCTVYLTACVITNNDALVDGGGIYNSGTLHLTDCTIANNTASSGGGIFNEGTLYMDRCCVSGNSAQYGGGGIFNSNGQAWLTNCTISGNSIWEFDFSAGGGIYNETGTITVLNCTIAYNSTSAFSGAVGGGFYDYSSQTMIFKNTIVAYNTAGNDLYNNGSFTVGGVTSLGNNIDSEDSCGFNQPTDQRNTNPLLGALQNNGGSTATHAIPANSPAFNKGTNSGAPATDQRSVIRPQVNICDIGAFELVYSVSTATGTGTTTFTTSAGALTSLTASASTPCGSLAGFSFPHGFFSFTITNITPGSTATITITLPSNVPASTQYWKCINGQWVNCTSLLGDNDGDNILTLTITDGGTGDTDGQANGTIVDPGGPARLLSTSTAASQEPSSSYLPERSISAPAKLTVKYLNVQPQQAQANQPVTVYANITNSGDESGSYSATLKVNGQVEETRLGKVGGHAAVPLMFMVSREKPGSYSVDVNGQQASFIIIDDGGNKPAPTKNWAIIGFVICAIGVVVVSALLIQRRRNAY